MRVHGRHYQRFVFHSSLAQDESKFGTEKFFFYHKIIDLPQCLASLDTPPFKKQNIEIFNPWEYPSQTSLSHLIAIIISFVF